MKDKINYLKKFLIVAIVSTIAISCATIRNVNALENTDLINESYYVDGVEYALKLNKDMEIIVESEDGTTLTLDNNGEGELETSDEIGDEELYQLDIENLSENNIDVEITDDSGNEVPEVSEEISDIDTYDELLDLNSEGYEGQSASYVSPSYKLKLVLGAMLTMLLISSVKIIGGVAGLVGTKVKEAIQKKPSLGKYYYPAEIVNGNCYVLIGESLSLKEAAQKLNNKKNIYTYIQKNARMAIIKSKYNIYINNKGKEVEIDSSKIMKKGFTYYWHYHIAKPGNIKINYVHAWYGNPYIKQ